MELKEKEVVITILNPVKSSRQSGTNPRKRGTNPRSKGTNQRAHLFLAHILEIIAIKEGRNLTEVEIEEYTNATIEFFVSQYESGARSAN